MGSGRPGNKVLETFTSSRLKIAGYRVLRIIKLNCLYLIKKIANII